VDEHIAAQLPQLFTSGVNALTRGDDFSVEAVFDLTIPGPGQSFNLTLTDRTQGQPGVPIASQTLGDDLVGVFVRGNEQGELVLEFSERDVVRDETTVYETITIAPLEGETQIRLRLEHDNAQPGVVKASFDLLGGARSFSFTATGQIFGIESPEANDDEAATQVTFGAAGDEINAHTQTVEGLYGSFSVNNVGEWSYALNNADADTQTLTSLDTRTERFAVRAVDEYGGTGLRFVDITVQGADEPAPLVGLNDPADPLA
jgi:VCBS repeat-containing protein